MGSTVKDVENKFKDFSGRYTHIGIKIFCFLR